VTSPLLSNIYLNELDKFVTDTLIPAYTKGESRKANPEYVRLSNAKREARKRRDLDEVQRLNALLREVPYGDQKDEDFRRLRYVRYADDFLLGYIGPRNEAEAIRDRLREHLRDHLKLTLSEEKTLITHATGEKAKFLGYEITVLNNDTLRNRVGYRTNGAVGLLMPQTVVAKVKGEYSRSGKVTHRSELLAESDYTIVQRYQSVLLGLYNYYCMAVNVSKRMHHAERILKVSLLKTLASKHRSTVAKVHKRMLTVQQDQKRYLQVVVPRKDKKPLVARFGGIPLVRKREGNQFDFSFVKAWFAPGQKRTEVVQRLQAEVCELCGSEGPLEAHHVRKLANLNQQGRKTIEVWKQIMLARKRKSLMVCEKCHQDIHAGRYDGPSLRGLPESRVR
jgi:hypothetical protein